MRRDKEIFALIEQEKERQLHGIELIASENFVSDEVLEAMGSVMTNKYAEGYPGARYYGGCQIVDKSEQLAIDRACALYGAEFANVQPHSGAQANMAAFMAVMQPGDTFLGLDLSHGGHLSHGSPVNVSGKWFKATSYQVKQDTGRVDYDEMEAKAKEHRPKLIVGGASAYSREWDYKRMREIADKIGALLMIDEVQTGMGRTGAWMAHHALAPDVTPDVVTLAKGLGGGVPIGATIATGRAAELLGPGQHGTTFGGNPVAAAAALAVIDTIREQGLLQRVSTLGDRWAAALGALEGVTEVRGRGLLRGIGLIDGVGPASQVADDLARRGFIVNAPRPDTLRLAPPFVLSDADADAFTTTLTEVLISRLRDGSS